MHVATKPLPRITPDSAPFWDAAKAGRLDLPFCTSCGKAHLPPGPVCPFCFSDRIAWRRASGRGKVSTFTVVHKLWFEAFAADVPYNVAQVELDEGPRLTTRIVDLPNERLRIGMPVQVGFEQRDGIALPVFRPAS